MIPSQSDFAASAPLPRIAAGSPQGRGGEDFEVARPTSASVGIFRRDDLAGSVLRHWQFPRRPAAR